MRMTLDELINAMEPQARKDKALISKCVDGLTEYAAELRQKAGDAGKEQISALRRLVDELAGYWGLDAKTVDHVTAFDRKIQEVDQAVHQWTPTQEHRDAVIQGLYLYAIDMISSLGSDGARESVTECERLMREIAGFWGYESPALDDLYAQIRASLKDQEAWDLRGSDYDPDLISTLEARVIVNYAGSILTPEPVIFPDGQDYLDVKGQTDFLDEEITLIDFCRQHEMPIPSRYQIRPASFDEAGLFYAMKPEEDQRLGCIGHVRMDFGHRGKEFWHTWWPRGPEELNSPEFKAELQQVVDELRTGVLKDLSSMSKYCWSHGGEVGNWPSNYGYIVETENYRYCLRCNPVPGDYQAYLTAFDLRVQRQNLAEQAAVIGRVTFASGEQQEYTDAETFLQCIRDELPNHPVTGFRYETLTDDPAIRKQVDDILYDLYGEENPRPLEDYENTPQEGMTMGGMT